jgi:hypothetical protein
MRRWLEDEELLSRHHISANFPRLRVLLNEVPFQVPTAHHSSLLQETNHWKRKGLGLNFDWLTCLLLCFERIKREQNVPSHLIKVSTRIIIYNRDYSITTGPNTLPDFLREYQFGLKGMNKGTTMMKYGTMTLLWQPYFCSSWGKGHIFFGEQSIWSYL